MSTKFRKLVPEIAFAPTVNVLFFAASFVAGTFAAFLLSAALSSFALFLVLRFVDL